VNNPHKWEDPDSSAETGTNTNSQHSTCTAEHSVSSRQVSWWSVHEFVQPLLDQIGNTFPTVGTPAWCALDDDDPVKIAAVYDAAQHHALRLELNQEARAETSRDVSAAADWPRVAQEMAQLNSFRATHQWATRVAS
jgi:Protein of unknown function (DUF2742)